VTARCFLIDCGADRNTLADYSRVMWPPRRFRPCTRLVIVIRQSVSWFREAMSWAQIVVYANPYCTCSSNTMSLNVSCWPMMSDELSGVQLTPRMRGPGGRSTSFRNGFVASGSTIQTDAAAFEF
jgi:hypothetical protein